MTVPLVERIHAFVEDRKLFFTAEAELLLEAVSFINDLAGFIRDRADEIEAGWPELTTLVDRALGGNESGSECLPCGFFDCNNCLTTEEDSGLCCCGRRVLMHGTLTFAEDNEE